MLVCHCKAIYERRVREVIAAGARDVFDVAAACAAGTGCGGCVPTVTRLLIEMNGQDPVADEIAELKAAKPT